jgi:hypothetical protein
MKSLGLSRYALVMGVVSAMLAGCRGSQPPIGAPGTMPQSSAQSLPFAQRDAIAAHDGSNSSWVAANAVAQDLLYVSDVRTVTVYSYPEGNFMGKLKHFYIASGMCVDAAGDVFITDFGYGKIFEYAHGSTKRVQAIDSPAGAPVGCSIDPTTGNLAVSTFGRGSGPLVAIFNRARSKASIYQDSSFYEFYFCSYDDKGNLFVDGITSPGSGHFGLAELPKGKDALVNLSFTQYISWPGGVEWDGKHLAIGDQNVPLIYQVDVNGNEAIKVGTTRMRSGAANIKQFWIQGRTLIVPNVIPPGGLDSQALFFKYPKGGKATKKITKGVIDAQGAVVSLALH